MSLAPRFLFVAVPLLLTSVPAHAQCRRLNTPLGVGRDVVQYATTPDGLRVLYRADADRDQVFELYSVSADGQGTPLKLHPALPSGRTVFGFRLDPSGTRALYHSNPNGSGRVELFSVPVDGSLPPVKLSPTVVVSAGGVQTLALFGELLYEATPDATRVLFVAAIDGGVQASLYSAPVQGGIPAVKLHPDPIGDSSISLTSHFRISPDSTWVVYQADLDTAGVTELYSAPVDGSGPAVKLSSTPVSGGDVVNDAFLISADSTRVVYVADQDTDGVTELYSVPIDGSASPLELNDALPPGGEVFREFELTPDGSRVVYRADQDVDGAIQLCSVPIDGSQAPLRIGGSSLPGRTVMHFRLSPDGTRVAYSADQDALHVFGLYCSSTDGSAPSIALSNPFPPDADVVPGIRFAPNGGHVLYVADGALNQRFDLYVVPSDGSAAPQSLHTAIPDADVRAFQITPDGTRVTFLADLEQDETPELFQSAISGGPALRLSTRLLPGREMLSSFTGLDDGAFFLSDQRQTHVFELFRLVQPFRSPGHTTGSPIPTTFVTRGL